MHVRHVFFFFQTDSSTSVHKGTAIEFNPSEDNNNVVHFEKVLKSCIVIGQYQAITNLH
jgi:uncharacterized membrane protein